MTRQISATFILTFAHFRQTSKAKKTCLPQVESVAAISLLIMV